MKSIFYQNWSNPTVRKETKTTHRSNISKGIILLTSTGNSEVENNDPRDANLSPHFQVNRAKARIECSTHKEVIDDIARHTDRSLCDNCMKVGKDGNAKPINHSDGHKVSIVVDNSSKVEDTSPVKDKRDDDCGVPTLKSIALVHQGFVTERWDRQTLLLKSRQNPCNEKLKKEIAGVHFPGIKIRPSILFMALNEQSWTRTQHHSPSSRVPTFSIRMELCRPWRRDERVYRHKTTNRSTSNTSR